MAQPAAEVIWRRLYVLSSPHCPRSFSSPPRAPNIGYSWPVANGTWGRSQSSRWRRDLGGGHGPSGGGDYLEEEDGMLISQFVYATSCHRLRYESLCLHRRLGTAETLMVDRCCGEVWSSGLADADDA